MVRKLKKKWNIESNFRFWLIFSIFGITGTSILFIKKPVFEFLGMHGEMSLWVYIPLYIVIVSICYKIILLFYGFIFGQFRFFWEFEKKLMQRMFYWKSSTKPG